MQKVLLLALSVVAAAVLALASPRAAGAEPPSAACWGQASAVFARMGLTGEHASTQANPRLGLANVARLLYEQGAIPEPTLSALGAFLASVLGLSVDACR